MYSFQSRANRFITSLGKIDISSKPCLIILLRLNPTSRIKYSFFYYCLSHVKVRCSLIIIIITEGWDGKKFRMQIISTRWSIDQCKFPSSYRTFGRHVQFNLSGTLLRGKLSSTWTAASGLAPTPMVPKVTSKK